MVRRRLPLCQYVWEVQLHAGEDDDAATQWVPFEEVTAQLLLTSALRRGKKEVTLVVPPIRKEDVTTHRSPSDAVLLARQLKFLLLHSRMTHLIATGQEDNIKPLPPVTNAPLTTPVAAGAFLSHNPQVQQQSISDCQTPTP